MTVWMVESFYVKRMENGTENSCVALFLKKESALKLIEETETRKDISRICLTEHDAKED